MRTWADNHPFSGCVKDGRRCMRGGPRGVAGWGSTADATACGLGGVPSVGGTRWAFGQEECVSSSAVKVIMMHLG